jgi:hypothetical protein
LTSNLVFGQIFIPLSKDTLYFPPKSFDCSEKYDLIGNRSWTGHLLFFNKTSLFKDTSSIEAYRMMNGGEIGYFSIIEIVKNDSIIICTLDSMSFDTYGIYKKTDTLKIEKMEKLQEYSELLWSKKSFVNCFEDDPIIDDGHDWVIEFKRNKKYKVIERHHPEIEIKNMINAITNISTNGTKMTKIN